jgi:hypothetical protein
MVSSPFGYSYPNSVEERTNSAVDKLSIACEQQRESGEPPLVCYQPTGLVLGQRDDTRGFGYRVIIMNNAIRILLLAGATSIATMTTGLSQPALADTTSTAIIAGAAAAIVGGLIFDSNRHQYYYQHGSQRHYVDNNTANYYRQRGGRYRGPEGHWHGNGYHENGYNEPRH